MSQVRDILLRVQEDCYGRLLAHGYLSDVAIISERRAYTADEVKKLLQTLKGRSGKIGAAVLVQRPLFSPGADDPSLRGQLVQAFTVIEHPTLNNGDIGTGKTAEEIAIEILNLFQLAAASLPQQAFSALPAGGIVPDDSFPGFNAYEVRLQLQTSPGRTERAGTVLITPDEGAGSQTVTLTCATGGAAIYYTLDGSYPSSANTAALLYSAPFVPGVGKTLRAAAEATGYQQSSIAEVTFD